MDREQLDIIRKQHRGLDPDDRAILTVRELNRVLDAADYRCDDSTKTDDCPDPTPIPDVPSDAGSRPRSTRSTAGRGKKKTSKRVRKPL
ncbi:MAG: hypothetical protein VW362_12245 [Candidatus Nanopelagicales bacterium]